MYVVEHSTRLSLRRASGRPAIADRFAAVPQSAAQCRYCCKSRKLLGADFPAVEKSDRRLPIDVASITLPGSPASFSSDDEVPHIFTWKSPGQPKEILTASAKRLLQQNRPFPDSCTAAKVSGDWLDTGLSADILGWSPRLPVAHRQAACSLSISISLLAKPLVILPLVLQV